MIEKGIRGGISHSIYQCAKANKKYMKDIKVKKHHIFNNGIKIIYMVGQCRKSFQ